MVIEVSVWRIDDGVRRVSTTGMDLENHLQEVLVKDISIVDDQLMVIGQKVRTDFGTEIDILGIDSDGSLVVIELKRGKTPRTVVAQVLEYASWVHELTSDRIQRIFADYQAQQSGISVPLGVNEALRRKFQSSPVELNASHRLMIVASEADPAVERIVEYLDESYGSKIEIALFRAFEDFDRQYITRAWIGEGDSRAMSIPSQHGTQARWNEEWYVVFSRAEHRVWADAVRYGFYSAGGGKPYVDAIKRLSPGDRIWVYVPGSGYVGVGTVATMPTTQDEFAVDYQGQATPILDLIQLAPWFLEKEENAEYFVRVAWAKTVDLADGIREPGFFANPNTVAQPRSEAWQFTVDFLSQAWEIE